MQRKLNIALRRKARGWSQRDLAAKVGVTCASVGFWETGARVPRPQKLMELADLFECTIDDLFDKAEGRTPA